MTKQIQMLAPTDYSINEKLLLENMLKGFEESVNATMDWLQTTEAEAHFSKKQRRLSEFMTESGIRDEWNDIAIKRATKGVAITEEIYEYARRKNMEDYLVPYTEQEKLALNKLCDYNYELIVNVTQDQIQGIRTKLIQDYAEGVNPINTNIKQVLEEIQLEPINNLSPSQRAEMIARTESARTLNTSSLETYRADGITHVSLYGSDQCDECEEYAKPIPIEEALEIGVVHPNCRCAWLPEVEV